MKLNNFQVQLRRVAVAWADRGCRETVANGGSCIDDVHRLYGNSVRESYCTKFVYVVVAQAAEAAGIGNPIPKTAGACDLRTRAAKAGLRIDKTPAIGSIFYRSSKIAGVTGHMGIVIDVTDTHIRTVEGNSSNKIDDWLYPHAKVKQHPRYIQCQNGVGYDFIHIEDAGGAPIEQSMTAEPGSVLPPPEGPSFGGIILISAIALATFYVTRTFS